MTESSSAGAPITARTSRGVIALIGAIVAAVMIPVSFVYGIGAALSGSGSGAGVAQVFFILGFALAIAAVVMSIVRLVRGAPKVLPVITIAIGLLPFVGLLVVYLTNLSAS